ncbi:predicted protein [Chaetomium globosum CBS 148.51]|uniref:Uncharacterized protein n=1 Tax=Chaetomium globosum (strain ATCC 6205 / CBS 148.51 / DSM 1962 / NBRC 6347 / NRRL 1970) TaxID=306901 RepID=Q2H8X5_CHAGB|nr:uncharacterized protein CHGG_03329 [Chaetomium globosum CBS 148.51]EAQ91394.1 predicted protein [Chaetomium globosum CBS 148.51]
MHRAATLVRVGRVGRWAATVSNAAEQLVIWSHCYPSKLPWMKLDRKVVISLRALAIFGQDAKALSLTGRIHP